jgi:long-subunit fatty acid transport protein
MSLSITWPQSASLGIAFKVWQERLLFSLQGDWTGWSSIQKLTIELGGTPNTRQMRYSDAYAVHLGAQGTVTRFLRLRLGFALDGNAIPDSTVRRENQDAFKATAAFGFGLHFWKLFIDGAFEAFLPMGARIVKQGTAAGMPIDNEGGSYAAHVYTAELSVQCRF